MHVGHSIPTEYMLQEDDKTFKLETVDKEKDLGIYVTNNYYYYHYNYYLTHIKKCI